MLREEGKLKAVGWEEIYSLLLEIAARVKASGFKPGLIVGVCRGGWVPARVLSDLLQTPRLANIGVEFYTDIYKTAEEPMITQEISLPVEGEKVLVVDDISDTGRSLRRVCNVLSKKAREIKAVTLYCKQWSSFIPHIYGEETNAWIIFPWEYYEAVDKLVKKWLEKGKKLREVKRELTETGLKEELLLRFIREILGEREYESSTGVQ